MPEAYSARTEELKTVWFSDRSAACLASGRPVLTEDTGFTLILPIGEGLLTFQTVEEAAMAVEEIHTHYPPPRSRRSRSDVGTPRFARMAAGMLDASQAWAGGASLASAFQCTPRKWAACSHPLIPASASKRGST